MSGSNGAAPIIIKKKKVSGGDGHHGGAWKVAYADFVTAMMAFFMLMWLLNATTEKQRKGLADYFAPTIPVHRVSSGSDSPFGGDSMFTEDTVQQDGTGSTEQRDSEIQQTQGSSGIDIDAAPDADNDPLRVIEEALLGRGGESFVAEEALKHIVTKVTDEGLIIELFDAGDNTLFEENSDKPTDLLRELTGIISRVAGLVENGIAVGAHVRTNAIVQKDNPVWDLSADRAARARVLLEAGGLSDDRIQRVTGFADRKPAVGNLMAERNNRVEIILLRSGASK